MKRIFGFVLVAFGMCFSFAGCADPGAPAIDPNEVEMVDEETMKKGREESMKKMREMNGQAPTGGN